MKVHRAAIALITAEVSRKRTHGKLLHSCFWTSSSLGPTMCVIALIQPCPCHRLWCPLGAQQGSRRLTGASWCQDAPDSTDLSRLGYGMMAWLTGRSEGTGEGLWRRNIQNQALGGSSNAGSVASLKWGFVEDSLRVRGTDEGKGG